MANTEAYEPFLLFLVYAEPMIESRTICAYQTSELWLHADRH